MKFLQQAVIIAAITFAAEIIKYLVPLPVPASIYGLILLFALLTAVCAAVLSKRGPVMLQAL